MQDVAHLYAAYARDLQDGTSEVTDFRDAVRMHRLIDRITTTASDFESQGARHNAS